MQPLLFKTGIYLVFIKAEQNHFGVFIALFLLLLQPG